MRAFKTKNPSPRDLSAEDAKRGEPQKFVTRNSQQVLQERSQQQQ